MQKFPLALKDKAKKWFKSVGQEFTPWSDIEKCFLRKFYSFGKTDAFSKAIRNSPKAMIILVSLGRGLWL